MQQLWSNYQKKYDYASGIAWADTIIAAKALLKLCLSRLNKQHQSCSNNFVAFIVILSLYKQNTPLIINGCAIIVSTANCTVKSHNSGYCTINLLALVK